MPVKPFNSSLWVCIFATTILTAIAFFVVDNVGTRPHDEGCSSRRGWLTYLGLLGDELFYSLLSLFNGESRDSEQV